MNARNCSGNTGISNQQTETAQKISAKPILPADTLLSYRKLLKSSHMVEDLGIQTSTNGKHKPSNIKKLELKFALRMLSVTAHKSELKCWL